MWSGLGIDNAGTALSSQLLGPNPFIVPSTGDSFNLGDPLAMHNAFSCAGQVIKCVFCCASCQVLNRATCVCVGCSFPQDRYSAIKLLALGVNGQQHGYMTISYAAGSAVAISQPYISLSAFTVAFCYSCSSELIENARMPHDDGR